MECRGVGGVGSERWLLALCPLHSYTWIVPITWMTPSRTGDRYWLVDVSGMVPGCGLGARCHPLCWWVWGRSRPLCPHSHQQQLQCGQLHLAPAEPQRQRLLPRQLQPGELGSAPAAALQQPPGTWDSHPTHPTLALPRGTGSALPQAIPVINRAQIIDDAFNLAR